MPPACYGAALFNQHINISVVKHTSSHTKCDKQAIQSLITGRVKFSHQISSDWVMFCCQVSYKNIIFRALRISELQIRNMDLDCLPPMVQTTGQQTGLQAKWSLLSVFINRVFYGNTVTPTYLEPVSGCFHTTWAALSSFSRDHLTKLHNIDCPFRAKVF